MTGLDLTVRVHQEDALRASEERSRALLEGIPDNIYRVARHDHRFIDIRWADPSRVTPEERERLIGSTVYELGLPPALAENFVAAAERAFETREVQELEYELEQDGEPLYLEARVVSSGEADYYVVVRDVSDRKWAELALKTQRDFLSAMGDATPSLLAVVGPEGVMSNDPLNRPLRELTGLTAEDAADGLFWEVISAPEDAAEAERVIRTVRRRAKPSRPRRAGSRAAVSGGRSPGRARRYRRSNRATRSISSPASTSPSASATRTSSARSRARIVEAGDAERRRLERNLHDGAQQRLVSLSLSLRLAQAKLAATPPPPASCSTGASDELAHALEELRELARGIHPAVLTDRGLGAGARVARRPRAAAGRARLGARRAPARRRSRRPRSTSSPRR